MDAADKLWLIMLAFLMSGNFAWFYVDHMNGKVIQAAISLTAGIFLSVTIIYVFWSQG